MSFDLSETIFYSKFINEENIYNNRLPLDLDDELIPRPLRESLKSENSEQIELLQVPSNFTIFRNNIVKASSSIELIKSNDNQAELHSNNKEDDDVINHNAAEESAVTKNPNAEAIQQAQTEEEPEIWFPTRTCPNECNCGKCPIDKGIETAFIMDGQVLSQSVMSLVPSSSSITMTFVQGNPNLFISITDVIPLRNNQSAIIHWSVLHYHGISGYKVFLDGNLVASVFSPTRTVAFIDDVNMKFPHHFAVSIMRGDSSVRETFQQHSMQAIYFYDPNNFIH